MLTKYVRINAIKLLLVGTLFIGVMPTQAFGFWWSKKKEEKSFDVFKHSLVNLFGAVAGLFCVWGVYSWIFNNSHVSTVLANKFKKKPIPKFDQEMSFDQWRQACQLLPKYGTVSSREKYQNTPLTKKEFERVVYELAHVMGTPGEEVSHFANDACWINQASPDKEYFELSEKQYFDNFFVQKLVCDKDTEVAIHADIHGDIHSIVAYMDDFVKKGLIDENFKITRPNMYMVFLGDYSDRGYYGAEVLYTIARLKIANPYNVIALRGNHENISINDRYGLIRYEVMINGLSLYKDGELLSKFGFTKEHAEKLVRLLYRMMPVALFVGCRAKDTKYTDYALLCHGGLETGFDPKVLFADQKVCTYQWLSVLNNDWLKQDIKDLLQQKIKLFDGEYTVNSFSIGFAWNDFIIDKTTIAEVSEGRGLAFGVNISRRLLEAYSSEKDNYRVKCIFRGHQHYGPMLENMKQNHGFYNLWSDKQFDEKLTPMNLAQALPVWVLNVSPCSFYGINAGYSYDAYGILKLNGQYENWVLEPHNIVMGFK